MPLTVTKTRTPVQFELIEKQDDRFQKVKIRIAHTGENLNNSYFSKEALESMKSSLANIPIVAFIEKNEDDKDDFSNHRQEITVKDGKVDVRYAGHAYGFVPEENNAAFEVYGGKEWLVCEGYLWTKFNDAMTIFDESNGVKSQSMEIQDVSGEADDLGRLVITDGRFSALCILGEDVEPAMTGSTVQLYSTKVNNREVDVMMSEFAALKKKKRKGGSGNVNDETKEVVEEKELNSDNHVDGVDEVADPKGDSEVDSADGAHDDLSSTDDVDDTDHANGELSETDGQHDGHTDSDTVVGETVEELGGVDDNKDGESAVEPDSSAVDGEGEEHNESHVEEAEGDSDSNIEEDSPEDEGSDATFTQIIGNKEFQLSHSDIRSKLYTAIDSLSGEREYTYIADVYSDHAIVKVSNYDDTLIKYLKVNYSEIEDSVSLGEIEEVFPMFLSESEKTRIVNERVEIQDLNAKLEELIAYRNEIEYSKKQEIVNEFSEVIGKDRVDSIESKFDKLSIDEVEREVAFEVYSLRKETIKNEEEPKASIVTNFSTSKTDGRYGSLDVYFQ